MYNVSRAVNKIFKNAFGKPHVIRVSW